MWELFVILALLIGTCYWIAHPLIQEDRRQDGLTDQPADILENLKNQKEVVYATIGELEFDLNMGKLTQEDFEILKRQYLQEAAGYMQQIDQLQSPAVKISEPIAGVPEGKSEPIATDVRSPESADEKYIFCSSCGERTAVQNRFCTACGSILHQQDGKGQSHG